MKRLFLLLVFLLVPSVSNAAACYRAQEAEAEQGIRIHSELMVIGLGCQHLATAKGKNLYAAYREFTGKHADLFGTYEGILMKYYQNNGMSRAQAEAKLNTLRTDFGNKIASDQASMRPDIFCQRYAPRITKVIDFERMDLRRWAATIYDSHPVSQPICEGQLAQ